VRAELAPAHIKSIDHVQLAMPAGEEAAARAFYSGILGIPDVTKRANLARRGGCWFIRGSLKIHLGVDPEFRPARKAHPALVVADLAGFRKALKTRVSSIGPKSRSRATTASTSTIHSATGSSFWSHSGN
jgi:hypothetical protein